MTSSENPRLRKNPQTNKAALVKDRQSKQGFSYVNIWGEVEVRNTTVENAAGTIRR
jgi:hypothetical protein